MRGPVPWIPDAPGPAPSLDVQTPQNKTARPSGGPLAAAAARFRFAQTGALLLEQGLEPGPWPGLWSEGTAAGPAARSRLAWCPSCLRVAVI